MRMTSTKSKLLWFQEHPTDDHQVAFLINGIELRLVKCWPANMAVLVIEGVEVFLGETESREEAESLARDWFLAGMLELT